MSLSIFPSEALPTLSDKCIFPQLTLSATLQSHSPLPHPLIYRLHSQDKSVLVGVKEFTAPEGEILVPQSVFDVLGETQVDVEIAEIPKATFLSVRPTQFYPHITNWKYYLESFLSKNYTTLSQGQEFGVYDIAAKTEVKLRVESANEPLVTVIDTDIALDVVPLNDIMAAQQIQHNNSIAYAENVPDIKWDTKITLLPFNQTNTPSIFKVDLRLVKSPLAIELTIDSDPYNADLLIGLDRFVTLENFLWCTMAQDGQPRKYIQIDPNSDIIVNYMNKHVDDDCWLYLVPFAWEHPCEVHLKKLESLIVTNDESGKSSGEHEGQVQCGNCRIFIDKGKFPLHEAFCLRNNVACSCGEIFQKAIPSTHWHCEECVPTVYGDSSLFKFKHEKLYHMGPYVCGQCEDSTSFPNFIDLVEKHKATTCPAKLHECIFCHLILPQEEATYVDKFANLTHHENLCGNKTTECFQCGKNVKTKDLASHLRIHYMNKVESASEQVPRCANENCINITNSLTNDLGLCDTCYGSLYAQVHDPTNIKLQNRIERKYIMQLTKGCGNDWCENPECASINKLNIGQALKHIQHELLPQIVRPLLPINKPALANGTVMAANHMWFCVNSSVDAKRRLFQKFQRQNIYSDSMILKALSANQDEENTLLWLKAHSV